MRSKASKGKTIREVVKNNLCTGCGTCISLCPCSAIELFKDDSKGVYLPRLSEEKCNQCGICFDVCPGHSVDFKGLSLSIFGQEPTDTLLGNYLECYIGHATDYDIRYNSASGGLVTAILTFALEEGMIDGALVTRMKNGNPLEPEPFIARTREEIISASKSKYCPVPANIALKEILSKEGKYAVVGLPCHVHGIRKAEALNKQLSQRIALRVGIFCSSVPSFKATEFLLRRMKLKTGEIEALEYRGEGWPGNMSLKLKNSKTELIPYPEYWDGFGNLFFPFRCKLCVDWLSKLADISCGDAWLPELAIDKIGQSVVVARSREGSDILQSMISQARVKLTKVAADKIIQSQGGFWWGERKTKIHFTMSKLFGKPIPTYDPKPLQPYSFSAHMTTGLLEVLSFLASRRALRWLVDIYCLLLGYGSYIKSRLRL